MAEPSGPRTAPKNAWGLTQAAFRKLLQWVDEGQDSNGQRYLELHKRLALYFDRKNCFAPDELADETLNRVARRLEEEGEITTDSPAHYCYIVARFVFLEYLRRPQVGALLDDPGALPARGLMLHAADAVDDGRNREKWLECLKACARGLDPDDRELILGYYTGEQRSKIDNRRAIAARLAITLNGLRIRACRLRDRLEACVRKCAEASREGEP
jgi:DNA-directed RNA polymerase specialized sigma24 family protein